MLRFRRTGPAAACALVALLLCVPAAASAATAPTLTEPAANASGLTEGGSVTFTWKGDLQGDATALDRSFFRVEVIAAKDMPSGAQAEWPESTLENYGQTDPGAATRTITLGVPSAGEYRWRVCAWGVASVVTANEIEQLPGGCSVSRAFTTAAAATASKQIGSITMEERTQVAGKVTTVYVPREETPADPAPAEPAPVEPAPAVEAPVEPTSYQTVETRGSGDDSALGLGDGLDADAASSRSGVSDGVTSVLGSQLPFVQIPFWTLLLLAACAPILVLWRRSVLGMFEWSDGSIDGAGTLPDPVGDLALVPVASDVKHVPNHADGDALAPASSGGRYDVPDRRRLAG